MLSLASVQKELTTILMKDQVLNPLQCRDYNCNNTKKSFCGFVLKKYLFGDVGFSIQKLQSVCCSCYITSILGTTDATLIKHLQFNDSQTIVYVTLHKATFIRKVLKSILDDNFSDEHNSSCKHPTTLVHMHDGWNTVGGIRLLLVAFLLKELFFKLGYDSDVYVHLWDHCEKTFRLSKSAINVIKQELLVEDWLFTDVASISLEEHKGRQEDDHNVHLDAGQHINDHAQAIKYDGEASIQVNASEIDAMMKNKANLVVHLAPHKFLYKVQQSKLLSNMVLEEGFSQKFCLCNVDVEVPMENFKMRDWMRKRKEEIRDTYQLKYGRHISDFESTVHQVCVASLILDIHSQNLVNKIKIPEDNTNGFSSRTSMFILYNYARICKIIKTFQQQVEQGIYPALPPIVDNDFTLLKEQSEWNILLRHLSMYPVLLEKWLDLVCNIDIKTAPSNKIYQFLEKLSFDLSSYYQQTKILLEARPHLFTLIHTRIVFITAVRSVMSDCFLLLGIDPPLVM